MKLSRLILILSVFTLTSCDTFVKPFEPYFYTPTPIVIIQTVVAEKTATPIPSPTPIAFLGTPISVDPELANAVKTALASLSPDLRIRSFTDHPDAGTVVWVDDLNHPDVIFCGAPIHIPGVGSMLILTSTKLYEGMKSQGIVNGDRGCIVVSLKNGRERIDQLLRYEYGIYSLMAQGKKFVNSGTMDSAVKAEIKPYHGAPLPDEMTITLAMMSGEDLNMNSVTLECPRDASQYCVANHQYRFVGAEFSLSNDPVKRIPIAYAESISLLGTGAQFLFKDRGLALKENAPEKSILRTEPYTPTEALTLYFAEMWRYYVYYSARISGMGNIAPSYGGDMSPDNAFTSKLNSFLGVPIPSSKLGSMEQKSLEDYFNGAATTYPFAAMEKKIKIDRSMLPDLIPVIVVIEE